MGFHGVDGRYKVGDGPVCLVGEGQCGGQRVIEVEDDRGWKRFWVRDKNFSGGQGTGGRMDPKDGSGFAVFGKRFHASRRNEDGDGAGSE